MPGLYKIFQKHLSHRWQNSKKDNFRFITFDLFLDEEKTWDSSRAETTA
jgi:hypothetical protein